MAYDTGAPYQPPRRPPPQGFQDGGFYDGGGYAPPPMGVSESPRRLNHYASQPQNLGSRYERDAARGGGFSGMGRGPARPPPSDGPFPSFGNAQIHSMGIDDGMRNMNLSGVGSQPWQAPPGGPQMRGGLYRNGAGAQPYPPGSGDPRLPPPSRGRGLPPGQRMPPLRGGMAPINGRGQLPPARPPMRQNTTGGYNGHSDGYGASYDDQYYWQGTEQGPRPPQRSMTMPTNMSQPQQYTAYNPVRHGTPGNTSEAVRPPPPPPARVDTYSDEQLAPQTQYSQWPRESVGALLDTYLQDQEYSDEHAELPPAEERDQELNAGYHDRVPKTNFSRPVLDAHRPMPKPSYAYPNNQIQQSTFAQQAHRARSQPSIRDQADVNNQHQPGATAFDGAVEMPAEVPDIPNGFHPPSIPVTLEVGSTGPSAMNHPHQPRMYPPRKQSSSSADGLPYHPRPPVGREQDPYSNPDNLPAHPPPIRPGLMRGASSASSHPPPMRQYSPDRTGPASSRPLEPTPVTAEELLQLQQNAKVNPNDQKLQLLLAKKMVEAASVLADESGRADVKTTRKNRENYILDAHKIVKKLTSGSHPYPDAMFYFATCYGEGMLGLQVDHERAFTLYQSAAKMNQPSAAYRTAVCCELGAGTRKDPLKAMTWYKKAASLGETPAMFKLGMILLKGLLGQARNPREGLNWLKRAADQADGSNQHALHELGLLYERTEGNDIVVPDPDYARELFVRAAELNYSASQYRLGSAYEYGTMGCPIDPRKSIFWYSKAAMTGDLESQLALSGWYLTGAEGVISQSDTEAYLWARKAAEKGLAKAEYALGYFTEVGIGVPANLDEAKRWYYKAASQSHPKAQQRLQELKKGGAGALRSRERLSRSNAKSREDGDCVIM